MTSVKEEEDMALDFSKCNGLIPAIIQDSVTGRVLMLGFMNEEAYRKTLSTRRVTFYSRTRGCLWTKGETSGNYLDVIEVLVDCDSDTLLIKAHPRGAVCHTGSDTCFGESNEMGLSFLKTLQDLVDRRHRESPEGSYTTSLFRAGINRISQKVGEEAIETVIESVGGTDEQFLYEASDLLYHLIVLLTAKGYRMEDLAKELQTRHKE